MMNHLSFLTERGICEFADSEEPVHEIVRVILLVDGVPYVQDWKEFPCEPLEIIALGARSGEIFPFNCKCGFRHCGGFEFPVVVSVNGDEISWTVPSAPFDKISSDGDGRPKARALRFQVEQYKDACDGLLKTLFLEEEKLGQLFTGASQRCKYSLAKQISIEKNKNGEIFVYMLDFEINLHYRNKGIGKKLDKFVAKIGILNGATKIFGLKSNDSPITPFFYDSQRYKSITIDMSVSTSIISLILL